MTEPEFHAVLLISAKGRLGSFSSNGPANKQTKESEGCNGLLEAWKAAL